MAYTIISQNNTTTTLSDENGNVITVPARVTLATSTDYTIIKVNNNSVDLEDGDGKIIRGVPACVVLAGGGGGGDQHNLGYYATQAALEEAHATAEAGDWAIVGATDTVWIWDEDTSAWVDSDQKGQVTSVNGQTGEVSLSIPDAVQYSTMPTASADNLGDIVQFTGTTGANYTNGYFYKCVGTGTEYTGDVVISANIGNLMVECDGDDFINFLMTEGSVADPTVVISGGMVYTAGTTTWTLTALDGDNNTVCTISATQSDYESAGFTFMGTPVDGDICAFVSTITGTTTYSWTRVDVQPAPVIPDPLPSQTGQSGKFLTTDGTDASWGTINALQNTATGTNSLTILGTAIVAQNGVNIGVGSQGARESVSVGCNANGWAGGTAIGYGAETPSSTTVYPQIAIGRNAKVSSGVGGPCIQIGTGTNSDINTFKVANANGNFEIMSADGTVPHGRLTNAVVPNVVTIAVADWNGGTTCTKTISGLTATSVVWVAPDNASQSDYLTAGVYASAQTTDTIEFSCATTPTSALTVNVIYC